MAGNISNKKFLAAFVVGLMGLLFHIEDENDTILVDKQARLPASRVKTFQYISHLQNMKFWTPGLIKFDPLDNHPIGLGKPYVEAYHIPFYGELEFDCVVMGYESPRFISYVCNNWLRTRVEMTLERSDLVPTHPTLVTFKAVSRRRSYLFKYILSPMIAWYEDASTRQALFSLRYALESS